MARRVCKDIGLKFAYVDLLHSDDGHPRVIEVKAIPGWKGAQGVKEACIATEIVQALLNEVDSTVGPFADG